LPSPSRPAASRWVHPIVTRLTRCSLFCLYLLVAIALGGDRWQPYAGNHRQPASIGEFCLWRRTQTSTLA
jgi:hypothetical protein